ncbi:MAG: metallophosphoesterase family protein [Chloroflexota bacterium]
MRIALLSDIHGNFVSLKAVWRDLERQGVDQVICLGDVATLGPQPREVVTFLREKQIVCVMGNHDEFVLNPHVLHTYMDAPWFSESIHWCIGELGLEDLDFLRAFRPLLTYNFDDETDMLCFHGSPHSNIDIILATTPAAEVKKKLKGYRATVMAGGHTHLQMFRQHNGLILLNPGSVGMPFEQMPFVGAPRVLPQAEYAILSWQDEVLGVELRRVPIDLTIVKQAALDSQLPEYEDWIRNWLDKWELL